MKGLILTDWFSGDAKPVRPGVYERDHGARSRGELFLFHKWDGFQWLAGDSTIERAERMTAPSLFPTGLPWRGMVPEVHGCVPSHSPKNRCDGCAFKFGSPECDDAVDAAKCYEESAIWVKRGDA